jgi:hypothetical protein
MGAKHAVFEQAGGEHGAQAVPQHVGREVGCPGTEGTPLFVQDAHQAISHLPDLLGWCFGVGPKHRPGWRNGEAAEIRSVARTGWRLGDMEVERTHGRTKPVLSLNEHRILASHILRGEKLLFLLLTAYF